MIQIAISKNVDGRYMGILISGHSNLAPKGYDIYCAGVSAISQSVVITLMNKLNYACKFESVSGRLLCSLIDPPDDITNAVFEVFVTGVEAISKMTDVIKITYTRDFL